ncbi:MAG: metallophosphoesterase [Planctomycetota bacterium]
MTSVLGTPIHTLAAEVPSALLISDLHVPADGGVAFAHLRAAVAAAIAECAPLFVLGDLFDSYVCRAQVRHGIWRDVAALFAEASRAGVQVTLLHGNRDFLLGAEFERASGARVVAGGLRGRLGGVDTLLLHGDELCQNDLPYQRAKKWLRNPVVKGIARCLPLGVALHVAERARQKSRMVIQAGDQTRFLPTTRALAAAFANGASRLVFGHIHRFAHGSAPDYWVLPAFDASGIGLRVVQGTVTPVAFSRGAAPTVVPEPAPCPFPA